MKSPTGSIAIALTALCCVAMGGIIGVGTNIINGVISQDYFITVMKWKFSDVYPAIVAQGILEGITNGVLFAVIFAAGFGIVTRGKADFSFAYRHLRLVFVFVLGCWVAGGLLGMTLAALSADFYRAQFASGLAAQANLSAFAWVGGSIQGAQLGAVLSAVLGIVVMRNAWNAALHPQSDN